MQIYPGGLCFDAQSKSYDVRVTADLRDDVIIPLYYNCQLRIVCLLNTVKNYSADVLGVSPSTFAPTPILLFFSPFMTSFYQCPPLPLSQQVAFLTFYHCA